MFGRIFLVLLVFTVYNAFALDNPGPDQPKRAGKIIINISDFDNDNGVAKVHLFKNPQDFPIESDKAIMRVVGKIQGGKARIVLENVPFGVYAFTVHHDENDNDKMDKNFFGLPGESYGFSNDLHPMISVPVFEEAEFKLNQPVLVQNIELNN
jgi:uncharacterized protein (DUF2141 family)